MIKLPDLHLDKVMDGALTGNPTAILSSAILFVPACRLTDPVNVNCLCSLVPKVDPVTSYNMTLPN